MCEDIDLLLCVYILIIVIRPTLEYGSHMTHLCDGSTHSSGCVVNGSNAMAAIIIIDLFQLEKTTL